MLWAVALYNTDLEAMMIDVQDLIDRFGENELIQITDHDHYQIINEEVANTAISDALAEMHSYLAQTRLFVQIADKLVYVHGTPPKVLVLKLCDMARYYLYENNMPDIVEKRYHQAINWLKTAQNHPALLTGTTPNGTIQVMPACPPSMWY